MKDFLLAPVLALFSLKFYRRLLSLPQSLGFLYLVYLSLILALAGSLMIRFQILPGTNEFIGWLKGTFPEMVVTREGLKMSSQTPQLLTHPKLGPVVYFSPQSEFPQTQDMGKAALVVTRTHIAYRDPRRNQYRIQSIVPQVPTARWRDVRLNGQIIEEFWRKMRPFVAPIAFLVFFVIVYIWKLVAGLLYSLVGLLINLFRKERLPYRFILNLAFFALTPITLVQAFSWILPKMAIRINNLVALAITAAYLAFAILATQLRREEPV